jgi:tetratricopeptide (TPR) repeat protein
MRDKTRNALACIVFAALAMPVKAQEVPVRPQDLTADERRCTGQWRATNDERIAACTVLIDSGRYQPPNLAILRHDRGVLLRAKGDLVGALNDFSEAVTLNTDYARAYADRGSLRLAQHDLDGAIADLDTAIRLDANDAAAFMTRGNAYDEKADFDRAIADYNEATRLSHTAARAISTTPSPITIKPSNSTPRTPRR